MRIHQVSLRICHCILKTDMKKWEEKTQKGGFLVRAENDGRKRILLNTYSFQAPEFYRSLGYEELLCVDPCFKDCKQYYFCKELKG